MAETQVASRRFVACPWPGYGAVAVVTTPTKHQFQRGRVIFGEMLQAVSREHNPQHRYAEITPFVRSPFLREQSR
ncbi:hypothetical protein ABFW11_24045, partial [Mycolicibacterium porcinum]|uniref:hypothetical protein n=1 Tax=Mycolicibacterium porcinum TaxID=39693 RepID=UPI0034CD5CBC